VAQVRVMDDLCDLLYLPVSNGELFPERLEGTVFSTMAEPGSAEHVEGDCVWLAARIIAKHKPCLRIDKMPNQPCRGHAVDSWPRPRHPDPVAVVLRFFAAGSTARRFFIFIRPRQQRFDFSSQRVLEEINCFDFLKTPPEANQPPMLPGCPCKEALQ